ncbi:MAG: hypothetical protein JO129_02915 [Candidatus Dependentiae bacterium]|nr:hypothetical protein [Candidatus Dependentiae bacterium]
MKKHVCSLLILLLTSYQGFLLGLPELGRPESKTSEISNISYQNIPTHFQITPEQLAEGKASLKPQEINLSDQAFLDQEFPTNDPFKDSISNKSQQSPEDGWGEITFDQKQAPVIPAQLTAAKASLKKTQAKTISQPNKNSNIDEDLLNPDFTGIYHPTNPLKDSSSGKQVTEEKKVSTDVIDTSKEVTVDLSKEQRAAETLSTWNKFQQATTSSAKINVIIDFITNSIQSLPATMRSLFTPAIKKSIATTAVKNPPADSSFAAFLQWISNFINNQIQKLLPTKSVPHKPVEAFTGITQEGVPLARDPRAEEILSEGKNDYSKHNNSTNEILPTAKEINSEEGYQPL